MINQIDVMRLREFTTKDTFQRIKEVWMASRPVLPVRKEDKGLSDKQVDIIVGTRDGWEQAIQFFIDLRENDIIPDHEIESPMGIDESVFGDEEVTITKKRRKKGEL